MSATAVIVLNALARDEFERDWHGFDEPFAFIDDGENPVDRLSVELEGRTYSVPAQDVAELIRGQIEGFRTDIESEALEEDEWGLSDEAIDEKVAERIEEYWQSQLENEAEVVAVFQCRLDYLTKGFQEFVAYSQMICDRQPAIRDRVVQRIGEVQAEMTQMFTAWAK